VVVPVTLKISVFALAVMGFYTYYANSIPQIESKPPEELSLEGGNVTPERLVAAGEKIFREKGQCTTCHLIGRPGGRGPDLAGVTGRRDRASVGVQGEPSAMYGIAVPLLSRQVRRSLVRDLSPGNLQALCRRSLPWASSPQAKQSVRSGSGSGGCGRLVKSKS